METIAISVEYLETTDSYYISDNGEQDLLNKFPNAVSYGLNHKIVFKGKTCWLPDYVTFGVAQRQYIKCVPK